MRKHDEMISLEDGYTAEDLGDLYNDAVELIWDLKLRLHETREFLDMFIEAYEEVCDKLYG